MPVDYRDLILSRQYHDIRRLTANVIVIVALWQLMAYQLKFISLRDLYTQWPSYPPEDAWYPATGFPIRLSCSGPLR